MVVSADKIRGYKDVWRAFWGQPTPSLNRTPMGSSLKKGPFSGPL